MAQSHDKLMNTDSAVVESELDLDPDGLVVMYFYATIKIVFCCVRPINVLSVYLILFN